LGGNKHSLWGKPEERKPAEGGKAPEVNSGKAWSERKVLGLSFKGMQW